MASSEYRALLSDWYEKGANGATGDQYAEDVIRFSFDLAVSRVLDYGCGRGTLGAALRLAGYEVFEYDPGLVDRCELPLPAELVTCTDVLEHVEPELLGNVLEHIKELSINGTFLAIACCASGEALPDGRNAHLIQRSPEWWVRTLRDAEYRLLRVAYSELILKVWVKS